MVLICVSMIFVHKTLYFPRARYLFETKLIHCFLFYLQIKMGAKNSAFKNMPGGSTMPQHSQATSPENVRLLHMGPLGSKPPSYDQAILSGSSESSKRIIKPPSVTMDTSGPPPPYQESLATVYPPFHPHQVIEASPNDICIIRLT